jgi:hypothetical protein
MQVCIKNGFCKRNRVFCIDCLSLCSRALQEAAHLDVALPLDLLLRLIGKRLAKAWAWNIFCLRRPRLAMEMPRRLPVPPQIFNRQRPFAQFVMSSPVQVVDFLQLRTVCRQTSESFAFKDQLSEWMGTFDLAVFFCQNIRHEHSLF